MRAAATLLLLLLVPAGALADDVHLTNGGVFEDVLAEWQGDSLRVRMPGGELRLARSSVERVVETTGGQAEYLRRAEALRAGRAGAAAWLDLARWARAEGLGRAAREAALEAGERDPRLAGLAPLLEGYGLVLHGEAGRWITHEESMRRQGFVRYDGRWITRREHAELERAAGEEAAVARAEIERRRVERAAAAARLAAAQLELERERLVTAQTLAPPVYYAPVYYPPFVVVPGFVLPGFPGHLDPHHRSHPSRRGHHQEFPDPPGALHDAERGLVLDITTRQPGSLFPARMSSGDRR